jgi:hypothetical protein
MIVYDRGERIVVFAGGQAAAKDHFSYSTGNDCPSFGIPGISMCIPPQGEFL